jgi:hypothetical protein
VIRRFALLLALAAPLLLAADPASPPPPADLATLFPREAEIRLERPGLQRLALPAEVLADCARDLADLRIFDASSEQVPYLVDGGAGPLLVQLDWAPEPRSIQRRRGSGRDAPRWVETLVLPAPEPDPDGRERAWTLELETAARDFERDLEVVWLGDDGRETTLLRAPDSLWRFGRSAYEQLAAELPDVGPGSLRVVLSGDDGGFLDPRIRLRGRFTVDGAAALTVPMAMLSNRSEGGRTVLELERPAGLVPDRLRIETTTPLFDRAISVWDAGMPLLERPPGTAGAAAESSEAPSPDLLGRGRVFRIEGEKTLEQRELSLRSPESDRLRLEIDDGDSPALEEVAVLAVLSQAALVFAGDPSRAPYLLRWGGARVAPPRYDVAPLLPKPGATVDGDRARAAAALRDPWQVASVELGPPRANPLWSPEPLLAFAMRPGAGLDVSRWRRMRQADAPFSSEGLSRFILQIEDLAELRADLGDLRVVDGQDRQWPYLLERGDAGGGRTLEAPATLEPLDARDGWSRSRLKPAAAPLPMAGLRIGAGVEFFDRPFRLLAEGVPGEGSDAPRLVASGRLRRAAGDPRPVLVAFPALRAEALLLEISDGDDAPLPLRDATLRVPSAELALVASPGPLRMLFGNPDAEAPSYEISQVRGAVTALRGEALIVRPLLANPQYRERIRLAGGAAGAGGQLVLWVLLVGAVVVLGVTTLRAVRKGEGEGEGS